MSRAGGGAGLCWTARRDGYPKRVTQTPTAPAIGAPVLDLRRRIGAYVALTKPRVIELLLVTTLPSMILAAHGLPHWSTAVVTMVGGSLAAGSANALNCYIDRDIDAIMHRTDHRPLAQAEVTPRAALIFGLALGVISVASIWIVTTWLAGLFTAIAIGFYVLVYTMLLKRRTAQNIVWGGAAGCMPVLIGWAAVTGSVTWTPVALFLVVFFWTPPHFWALAIRYKDDYARAGIPMLPVVATPIRVARDMVIYAWLTVAASLAVWPLGAGWVYGVLAAASGAVLLVAAHRLYHRVSAGQDAKAMSLFHLSNSYLAFLFVAIALDTFLRY